MLTYFKSEKKVFSYFVLRVTSNESTFKQPKLNNISTSLQKTFFSQLQLVFAQSLLSENSNF